MLGLFKLRFLEKEQTILHESLTFPEHGFSFKRTSQPICKFSIKKYVLLIYRTLPRTLDFLGRIAAFLGALISRCLASLCKVNRRLQHRKKAQSWYRSADKKHIFLHVKCEGVLSVLVLRNRATLYKNLRSKTDEFLKSKVSKYPPLLNSDADTTHQVERLVVRRRTSTTDIYAKERVVEMLSIKFY